jgi:type I restriction enzyme S subunit
MNNSSDWKTQALGRVARLTMGQSPDSKYYSEEESGWPFLQGCAEFQSRFPAAALYCTQKRKLGKRGSILFSVRAPVGRINIADRDYVIGRGLAAIVGSEIDQDYLEHYLNFIMPAFRTASQGSTFEAINSNDLNAWPIAYPSAKPEQSKAAHVLSTADRAIEHTEVLIAKQQRIKTGLMQDLLTRGIDEHGNLRSEQTHPFKDSLLGRIPIDWEVRQLADVLADTPRNGIYKPAGQIGSGRLLIGQTSFTHERRIDYRLSRRAEISNAELRAYGLRDDDILVTRVFATVAGVRRPVLVSGLPEPAVYESNILRLRIDRNAMHPTLLFHWLLSSQMRKLITSAVNASNQTSVNQKVLNELPVPIPPGDEQRKIVETISAQEIQLGQNENYNYKLRALKAALMQDLLTGNKRVTPLLELEPKLENVFGRR